MRYRRAFTMVELLVVIVVIALLVALLLPAVQAARNAAMRAQCANNMRQLGDSLNSHVSRNGVLPLGSNGLFYSFQVMLLPDLEQSALFNSINFSSIALTAHFEGSPNSTAAAMELSVLLCPSDTVKPTRRFEFTSYAGNGGYGPQAGGCNGLFGDTRVRARVIGHAAVVDGSSQTLALSEWVKGSGSVRDRDPISATLDTTRLWDPDEFNAFVIQCRSLDPASAKVLLAKKCAWIVAGYGNTTHNSDLGPNGHSCANAGSANLGAFSASSRHAGGVNALYLDGHVAFVRDSIDLATWRSLSTRSGEEIVTHDAY